MNRIEAELQNALILRLPYAIPGCYVEVRRIINAETSRGYRIKAGTKGQCDIFVIINSIHKEIELKSDGGRLRPEQRDWQAKCLACGIPHVVLFQLAGESHVETVDRWIHAIHNL